MSSLREKTVSGVVWTSVQRFGSMAITFIANMILARLLVPSDVGCVGMLMIFISLSNTFIDGGFGSALIQKKDPTQADYSTIFFWNIFLSLVLYGILYLGAPFIAKFYRIELLASVLRVQGVVLILNALNIIQANKLRKELQFKKLSLIEITAATISLAIAIIFAAKGFGIWSLVVQQISHSLFRSIFLWFSSGWQPSWIFSWKSFRELFKFGGFMLLSSLFSTFSNEVQGLLVGRRFSPSIMGYYSQAMRLEGSFATAVSSIVDQVTYPLMASIQDDKNKLILALKRFIQVPAYVCSLVIGLAVVIAKPLISIIYGEQWLPCVPYFRILCVAGVAVCLQGSANNSIAAIGKSNVFFTWTIIKRSLTILFCLVGILMWGMYGLLWSCVLGAWLVYVINAYLVQKHVGYSIANQILDIAPFMLMAVLDGLFVYWVGTLIDANMYIVALIQSISFIAIYLLLSVATKLPTFYFIVELLRNLLSRKR